MKINRVGRRGKCLGWKTSLVRGLLGCWCRYQSSGWLLLSLARRGGCLGALRKHPASLGVVVGLQSASAGKKSGNFQHRFIKQAFLRRPERAAARAVRSPALGTQKPVGTQQAWKAGRRSAARLLALRSQADTGDYVNQYYLSSALSCETKPSICVLMTGFCLAIN